MGKKGESGGKGYEWFTEQATYIYCSNMKTYSNSDSLMMRGWGWGGRETVSSIRLVKIKQ